MRWTRLVSHTSSRQVGYGSVFRRFFWLYFEYLLTVDLRKQTFGKSSVLSQNRSIAQLFSLQTTAHQGGMTKRAAGIEPAYRGWKPRALPLSYARGLPYGSAARASLSPREA